MVRRVLVIAAYLALGAVASVLGAWGFALWRPVPQGFAFKLGAPPPRELDCIPSDWPACQSVARADTWGITLWQASYEEDASSPVNRGATMFAFGWPFRSMCSQIRWYPQGVPADQPLFQTGFPIPNSWPRWMPLGRPYASNLPLRPMVFGFVADAAFFAALMWTAAASLSVLHRRRRSRRGQCVACGYPIGASPVCSECGRPVKPAARPTATAGRGTP